MNDREITIHVKVSRRSFIWAAAALLMCCSANEVVSESLTMTTYYPAPSGVYKRLTATEGVAVGTYKASAAPAGDLIVSGSVGIGTTSPANKLSVAGNADVSGNIAVGGLMMAGQHASAQESALSKVEGAFYYATDLHQFRGFQNGAWQTIGGGGGGAVAFATNTVTGAFNIAAAGNYIVMGKAWVQWGDNNGLQSLSIDGATVDSNSNGDYVGSGGTGGAPDEAFFLAKVHLTVGNHTFAMTCAGGRVEKNPAFAVFPFL